MTIIKSITLVLLLSTVQAIYGQSTNKTIAKEKTKEAVQLMDAGKIEESLKLLKEAVKLDPDNMDYPYEMGYAYYLSKDYKKAIECLESIRNHKDVNDRVYQLLGNSFDYYGQSDKAIQTYESGLKLFPNSGNL